jgi:hypothetical protein
MAGDADRATIAAPPSEATRFETSTKALASRSRPSGEGARRTKHFWLILHDARDLAFARGLELVEDDGLLEEVAGLVEWPVATRFETSTKALASRSRPSGEGARRTKHFWLARIGLELVEDDGLLEEVAGLVEWPVTLIGGFEERFLAIAAPPSEATRFETSTKALASRSRPSGEGARRTKQSRMTACWRKSPASSNGR